MTCESFRHFLLFFESCFIVFFYYYYIIYLPGYNSVKVNESLLQCWSTGQYSCNKTELLSNLI